MIKVIHDGASPEAEAADSIAAIAKRSWPWLENDKKSCLWIVAGVQCHGQQPRDIDIVVLGYFTQGNNNLFRPNGPLTGLGGGIVEPSAVRVDSLCLVIELKDHSPEKVQFNGNKVSVLYGDDWHDASAQSFQQVFSLLNYFKARNVRIIPRVTNLVWLRNIAPHQLPKPPHNILHGNLTWNGLLHQAALTSQIIHADNQYIFSALNKQGYDMGFQSLDAVVEAIALKLSPSALDRRKMDAMVKDPDSRDLYASIGKKMLLLRGHGGTGKTMLLLQIAYRACNEGNNVVLLTFNKALVADIRRIMALAKISDDFLSGSIQVMTVHSFFYGLLHSRGLIGDDQDDFLENYSLYLELLSESILESTEKDAPLKRAKDWNLVLLDEAQDWPKIERDLLVNMYGGHRLVVADGLQQLVRGQDPCDWRGALNKDEYEEVSLSRGLRMKRNLAAFSNRMARLLGLEDWHVDELGEALGGRIIVVEGSYFSDPGLHKSIVDSAKSLGNRPVDLLACIPPRYHGSTTTEHDTKNLLNNSFDSLGQQLWDGTSSITRGGYPTSLEQLRLVQYESCRGLEGWSVINLGFDSFYQYKNDRWERLQDDQPGVFLDDTMERDRFSARWIMIALTRAIDTIIIEVSPNKSSIKRHLANLYNGDCKDFMEWRQA